MALTSKAPAINARNVREEIEKVLIDQFDIEPADISPEALLADDLGIDSIDAVDLIVRLREITGVQVPPAHFKDVKTVADVESVISRLIDTDT